MQSLTEAASPYLSEWKVAILQEDRGRTPFYQVFTVRDCIYCSRVDGSRTPKMSFIR